MFRVNVKKAAVKAIALFLLISTCLCLFACENKKTEDGVVATENFGFTNGMFVYYMLKVTASVTEEEMKEHGFDESLGLDEQIYEGDLTWYGMIVERAINSVSSLLLLCETAKSEGVELAAEEIQEIEALFIEYRLAGVQAGNMTLDQYLEYIYGYKITEADLYTVYVYEMLSSKYLEKLYGEFEAELSEGEIQAVIDGMSEEERDTSYTRNIGHILISPAVDGGTYDEKADELFDALEDMELDEETFLRIAKEKSSEASYLFEEVAKDEMISKIDEWVFAEGREVGDLGMVESEYGIHILYYLSEGEQKCILDAKSELISAAYDEWFDKALPELYIRVDSRAIDKIELSGK